MSKIRLGGMALSNGVLVHGPTAWACAIRTSSGEIKVASAPKRLFAPGVQTPFLRGPLRLAESFAMIPDLRRKLPEARLPFERPGVIAATLIIASAAGNVLAARAPAHLRGTARTVSSIGAVGAAVEVFAWMTRHPGHPVAKALAFPGHELQHRIATAEPSPEQLEVAEVALAACLELENGDSAAH